MDEIEDGDWDILEPEPNGEEIIVCKADDDGEDPEQLRRRVAEAERRVAEADEKEMGDYLRRL